MTFIGKKVLVTGGTGFIGGRLIEKLVLECDAKVRVLIRNFARAPRISPFPLEMIHGDITDFDTVRDAADSCDVIFHCAYGNSGTPEQMKAITVDGTEAVAKAALATGVSRMVHVSTAAVYVQTPIGDLDETAPRQRSGNFYADTKLEAERLVFNYHENDGLPVTVIQPPIVYGPFSRTWTVVPLEQLKQGRVVLINGGDGLCNAVYVDDVVQAMILAATHQNAAGEAFLVSGEEPVTWQSFYEAYERMLGYKATMPMTMEELRNYLKQEKKAKGTIRTVLRVLRKNPNVRSQILQLPAVAKPYLFLRSIMPDKLWVSLKQQIIGNEMDIVSSVLVKEKPIIVPSEVMRTLHTAKTSVCIEKAKKQLGYQPQFDLELGMQLTEQWARWANLLD